MISKIEIFGGKAIIKQNKFGVWKFRMWISSEKKYVEKSLRTKKKTDAVDLAEELYIHLRNDGVAPCEWSTNWDRLSQKLEDQRWLENEKSPKRTYRSFGRLKCRRVKERRSRRPLARSA